MPCEPVGWEAMKPRAEFMAIPIVAAVFGVIFLIMLTAEAETWGWLLFGVGAIVVLAVELLVLGRRHQHPSDLDAPALRAPGGRDGTFRVLVVSDGSATSQAFHDEVVGHAAGRPVEVLVVAPALGSRLSHWTGDDHARDEAQGNVERTVEALAAASLTARGEVGADDPIQAADDALREFAADEVVFATHPDWKERDVIEIARARYDLTVTHVVVDAD